MILERQKDLISSTVIFAFAAAALVLSKDMSGGAEIFPRGLALIMLAGSLLMFIRAVLWPDAIPEGQARMTGFEGKRIAIGVALTLAYAAAMGTAGFAVSSVLFVAALSYALGYRNHVAIWVTAVIFVAVLDLLFVRIFHTPLPAGMLLKLWS